MFNSFEDIVQSYDGFSAPALSVKVDGKDIATSSDYVVTRVHVDLDMKKANVAEVTVRSAQDDPSSNFRAQMEKVIIPGSIMEVKLGYTSKLKTVFYGCVDRVEFTASHDDDQGLIAYAFDVRRYMMRNDRKRHYQTSSKATLINEVLSDYKKMYKSKRSTITSTVDGNVSQDDTDYNFIVNLLKSESSETRLYVMADELHIDCPSASAVRSVATLERGAGLYSVSDSQDYLNAKVQVNGYDPKTGKPFSATSGASGDGKQRSLGTALTVYGSGSIAGQDEARRLASRISEEMESRTRAGSVVSVGLPELIAGATVKIVAKDLGMNGYYLINGAEHTLVPESGYTTSLRFGEDVLGDALAGEHGEEDRPESKVPLAHTDGIMYGRVVKNWSSEDKGKLLVDLGVGEEGKTRTEWIPYAVPYAGNNYGLCFCPEVGTQVIVGFVSGDRNAPVVLGQVRDSSMDQPKETLDDKDDVKAIVTRGGHKIVFNDKDDAKSIEITTAGGLLLKLDDKSNTIVLSGKDGKNKLVVDDKQGEIELVAEKKFTIKVGGKSSLELTATDMNAKANKVQIKADSQLSLGGSQTAIEGTSVNVKGSGSLKVESSGVAEVKGSLLKLN